MKNIGFPISYKENENRRALIPRDIVQILHPKQLFFEVGYGEVLGISDSEYKKAGAHVVLREEVLKKEIICDPKVGDANYIKNLHEQTVFGWVHAVQNRDITNALINGKLTAYAWEDMYEKGRHVFWRNNELAGEAAVIHAFQCYGSMPYETNVAVIGRGNTARGAIKILNMLGAKVNQYDRCMEELLRDEIGRFDVIINCVLWDVTRTDHIIYKSDLKRMKSSSMIIDVSCDRNGGIETCTPTTFFKPTYVVDGILHYAVDHTPSLFFKTFTNNNSELIAQYLNMLMFDKPDNVLNQALIIQNGIILDERINIFQKR